MSSDTQPSESGYDLVMPFVTVTSKGGPHDDQSYVAGWEMGNLDAALEYATDRTVARSIRSENAAQADLLAMKHGYRCELTEYDDQWTIATFTRQAVSRG